MTDRAHELVAEAISQRARESESIDLLGELTMSSDMDTDATTLAERFREAFNIYRQLDRRNAAVSICADPYSDFARMHADSVERRHHRGQAHGIAEAEAEPFAAELAELRVNAMTGHRMHQADATLSVIDPRKAEDGGMLPAWDIDNPMSHNVMRGILATYPDRLYVLRGGFGPQDLAQHVYDGDIATRCNVGVSALCDPRCASERATGTRPIWGMFALSSGPHVIFYSVCQQCYWESFHSERNQIGYDVLTPEIDDADDWQQRHG